MFSHTCTKEDAVMVNHCKDLSLHQTEFPINYFILIQLFIAEWYKVELPVDTMHGNNKYMHIRTQSHKVFLYVTLAHCFPSLLS